MHSHDLATFRAAANFLQHQCFVCLGLTCGEIKRAERSKVEKKGKCRWKSSFREQPYLAEASKHSLFFFAVKAQLNDF